MPNTTVCAASPLLPTILLGAGGAFVSPALAQQRPVAERELRARESIRADDAQTAPPARAASGDVNAQATRHELSALLQRHPPSVGAVLKLDPSLMRNESYLASYPAIREFLLRHPEIPQNSSYYFSDVYISEGRWQRPSPQVEMVGNTLGGLAAAAAFIVVLSTLIWLVRTVLDQRRWSRLSKIQAEVHSKLMDRFSSNDELLTYVQTPSGRRFLESGPSPLQEEAPSRVSAPFTRILWSVQIGVVLLVGGVGLLFVSGRTLEELREFFFICGILSVALGAGFAVSAAASYVLSRRLGLFERPGTSNA